MKKRSKIQQQRYASSSLSAVSVFFHLIRFIQLHTRILISHSLTNFSHSSFPTALGIRLDLYFGFQNSQRQKKSKENFSLVFLSLLSYIFFPFFSQECFAAFMSFLLFFLPENLENLRTFLAVIHTKAAFAFR